MAFWLDRFRREDEEDIWEELKQMLLNPPSEQEIALKKQQEQAWIDSILNKAFPENPNAQTEQTLKTNNSSMSPISTLNQNSLEGFGQNSINGFTHKKKQNEFPDLGKATDYKNESFAPVYDEEEKEMRKSYLVDPNQNIVIDEIEGPFIEKKQKPKYEAEEPVEYEEMPDEEEDTTSEELETSEETEEGNSKEEPEETSSELQDEPYLRYEDLLPDETDEEREAREARELEAFNKAWDKANGVEEKDIDGVPTGAAADISKKIVDSIEGIKNIPQDLLQKTKNKVFDNANRDFDRNAPMTLEEKFVQQCIETLGRGSFPMASDATRNGMHDMQAAKNQNNVKVYDNLESLEDTKLKDTLKKIGAKNSDKGAIYDVGSRESEAFSNSPELDVYLTKNRANVLAGKPLEDTSLYYDANSEDARSNQKKYDRYATARKITMVNPKVDENGIFTCELVDYSNFEDEPVNSVGTYLNKWGYKMQEKGLYKPHYQIIKIRKKVNW